MQAANDSDSKTAPDGGGGAACDATCPMHLALMPAGLDSPPKSAPKPYSLAVPESLTAHAPPSPERPPRPISA